MILSGRTIRNSGILTPCHERTQDHGLSYGLSPAGYDLRLDLGPDHPHGEVWLGPSAFLLAAAQERFKMPTDVVGRVCDKSTWARRGLSVFNTVIEPGWEGFLTLELVNHSSKTIRLVKGMGIAQVLFEMTDQECEPYNGKYQHQEAGPQGPRHG
jgi:dCTP deaminase